MSGKRCLILYLAFPVFLAVFNGVRGTVYDPEMSPLATIVMFIVCGLMTYGFAAVIAHTLRRVLSGSRIHPVFALFVSALAAIPFSYFVIIFFIMLFGTWYPNLEPLLAEDGIELADGGFLTYAQGSSGLLLIPLWVGVHYVYEAIYKDALFFPGFMSELDAPDVAKVPIASASPFLNKLKQELGQKILALEAQEHYVRVYTDQGDYLLLYRFGDAVQEVTQSYLGLQVHRSYWVSEDAVAEIQRTNKTYSIKLSNGLEVPVSNSYRKVVEQYLLLKPQLGV